MVIFNKGTNVRCITKVVAVKVFFTNKHDKIENNCIILENIKLKFQVVL